MDYLSTTPEIGLCIPFSSQLRSSLSSLSTDSLSLKTGHNIKLSIILSFTRNRRLSINMILWDIPTGIIQLWATTWHIMASLPFLMLSTWIHLANMIKVSFS